MRRAVGERPPSVIGRDTSRSLMPQSPLLTVVVHFSGLFVCSGLKAQMDQVLTLAGANGERPRIRSDARSANIMTLALM